MKKPLSSVREVLSLFTTEDMTPLSREDIYRKLNAPKDDKNKRAALSSSIQNAADTGYLIPCYNYNNEKVIKYKRSHIETVPRMTRRIDLFKNVLQILSHSKNETFTTENMQLILRRDHDELVDKNTITRVFCYYLAMGRINRIDRGAYKYKREKIS